MSDTQLDIDECIELAERECELGECPCAADCDAAGRCLEGAISADADDAANLPVLVAPPDEEGEEVSGEIVDEPVDTAELLGDIQSFITRFVKLPDEESLLTMGLWVLHTWSFAAAAVTPYLVIESAEPECGKSMLLEQLDLLCKNALMASSMTAAALYQVIDKRGKPTLLIDEADAIFGSKVTEKTEELRGMINAGNKPRATVMRGTKEGVAREVNVFCPKAIAGIATGALPRTIRSRSLVIPMLKLARGEQVERFRERSEEAAIEALRERCQRWAEEVVSFLTAYELPRDTRLADPDDGISPRHEEAWEPLIGIAQLAGRAEDAIDAALIVCRRDDEFGSKGPSNDMLAACYRAFGGSTKMFSDDLVNKVNADLDAPFGKYNKGDGATQNDVARLLRPYRIHPTKIRIGTVSKRGYRRDDFLAAWERYLDPVDEGDSPEEVAAPF